MAILAIMALGIAVGFLGFPEKWSKYNHAVQVVSIVTLIFCMGVSLGNNDTFIEELADLGMKGVVFAIVPIICSIGVVYVLTQKLMKEKDHD